MLFFSPSAYPRSHLARQATRLFSCDLAPRTVNKANRRAWLRAVTLLGDRWVLRRVLTVRAAPGSPLTLVAAK